MAAHRAHFLLYIPPGIHVGVVRYENDNPMTKEAQRPERRGDTAAPSLACPAGLRDRTGAVEPEGGDTAGSLLEGLSSFRANRRRRRRILPLLIVTLLALLPCSGATEALAGPAAQDLCQLQKGRFAGQYASCMQDAYARLAVTPGECSLTALSCTSDRDCPETETCVKPTGAGSAFLKNASRCAVRFDRRWDRAEIRAGAGSCVDGLTPGDVRTEIDSCAETVAAALAGEAAPSCPLDLAACVLTIDECEASLAATRDELGTWSGIPDDCFTTPGPDCVPPAGVPEGVVATAGDASVGLDWAALSGADAYGVERRLSAGGSSFSLIGRTSSTQFFDDTVTNDEEYHYRVFAVNNGYAGAPSAAVAAVPRAVPAPPTGVTATSGDTTVLLEWTPATDADATRVLRASTATGPWEEVARESGASSLRTGLANGTAVWFALASVNPVGESAPTPPQRAIPIAPPSGVFAVPGEDRVTLFWSPSIGATSYEMQRADDPGGPWSVLGQTSLTRRSDPGVPEGVPFFYRVLARNEVAASSPSPAVEAIVDGNPVDPPPLEDPSRNLVGQNLWFNRDWGGAFAFVDVMKESRPWQDAENWNLPVGGVDALGCPTADASTVVFSGLAEDFNGTYALRFEGQADVSLLWCPGTVENKVWDPATNTTTADVTFAMTESNRSVGLVLRNTRRTAESPVGSGFRDLRLYRPGYPTDGSVLFTTPFLEALGSIDVLRMMDWGGGSSNLVEHWADRSTPAHATQGGLPAPPYTAPDGRVYETASAVSLEHRIQLCNALMTDCWINVPPVADDEYIQNMALLLRYGSDGTQPYTSAQENPVFPPLDPSLRLYLEYSNENWNSGSGFLAFHVIQGICAHLDASHPVMNPVPDSIYTAVWRYPAWRIWTIGEIFRDVFGDDAMMSRIRPMLMTQRGNAQATLSNALLWLESFLAGLPTPREVRDVVWGAGGSGYWGARNMVSAIPDTFFGEGNIPDDGSLRDFAVDSVWTGNYGIRHIAYEGGPGLSFSDADNRTLNADPRMKDAVEAVHDLWSGRGGSLLVYYTVRGPSQWEFTASIDEPNSPKLQALDALRARPRAPVSIGAALPGRIIARDPGTTLIRTGYGYDLTIDGLLSGAGYAPGQMLAMAAHADTAFTGTLGLTAYAPVPTRVAVWINGERQGEVEIEALSGPAHLYESTTVPVSVPVGLVVVRLEILEGSLVIYSADF